MGQCFRKSAEEFFLSMLLFLFRNLGGLMDAHQWKKEALFRVQGRLNLIVEQFQAHISEQKVREVIGKERCWLCIGKRRRIRDCDMWICLIILLAKLQMA